MTGITQKAVWLYFHCGPSKKKFLLLFLGGGGRADVNQQKLTKKNQSLKLIRSHVSIMTAATVIIISLIINIMWKRRCDVFTVNLEHTHYKT